MIATPNYYAAVIAAVERVRAVHKRAEHPNKEGIYICEECHYLCHSRSGLVCDDVDGEWPCATIQALDAS